MSTYTKILTLPLDRFNNAEFLAYMNSVLSLLPPPEEQRPGELSLDEDVLAQGSPEIGLTKEFVATMEKDVLDLGDDGQMYLEKISSKEFVKCMDALAAE